MTAARNSGFTLSEMATVIFISGLLLVAAASIATPLIRKARLIENTQKLENIARALDHYAAQNLRLPCPASPDSASGNETGNGADCGNDPAAWEGIVPFRTLGIPAEWIKDSSNNYITYAISPAFSQDVSQETLPVHARCRTADWFMPQTIYEKDVNDPKTGRLAIDTLLPKDERKARFCCSGALPDTDLVVLDVNRQPQIAVSRQKSPASYRPANVIFPDPYVADTPVKPDDRDTAPVYVLVSHGSHGGAWKGDKRERFALDWATPAEKENANGDRTFVDIPPSDRTNKEISFDDLVVWRTQDMIFAEQGKSCSLP